MESLWFPMVRHFCTHFVFFPHANAFVVFSCVAFQHVSAIVAHLSCFSSNEKRHHRALALAAAVAAETFRSFVTHGESRVRVQNDAVEACVRIVQDACRSHVGTMDDAHPIVIEEF